MSLQSVGHKLVTDQQQGPFLNLILGDGLKNIAAIFFRRIFCPCFPVEV